MLCPKCDSDTVYVKDTMHAPDKKIYRRRKCSTCGLIFRTVEVIDDGTEEFRKKYVEAVETKHPLFRAAREERRNKNESNNKN